MVMLVFKLPVFPAKPLDRLVSATEATSESAPTKLAE
jgi:hypothetical protein